MGVAPCTRDTLSTSMVATTSPVPSKVTTVAMACRVISKLCVPEVATRTSRCTFAPAFEVTSTRSWASAGTTQSRVMTH